MDELRVVIDTGVVVSAVLLPRSIPRQAFDVASERGQVLLSEATLAELEDVLRRPKFDKYVSQKARVEFLLSLLSQAEVAPISERIAECRDPKDDKFLELAVAGRASDIVSGDGDLLSMHSFRGISIVSPEAFLKKNKE